MKNIEFSRELIKGRIAEVIFEQMIREEEKYTVIPFGYEHTMPTLAQYRHLAEIPKIIDNIADAPDFALISENNNEIFLVEVKYQHKLNLAKLEEYANKLLNRWDYPWLFVATLDGFYCGLCKWIVDEKKINKLSENWVTKERQVEYLELLKEFEKQS
ncbi:MAG: hypothetical protein HYY86_02750 [Candidatus Harrisonbacteria bacterium]|nr:hypothetical protein [Candidatus Harrisonbacteria bacterium]